MDRRLLKLPWGVLLAALVVVAAARSCRRSAPRRVPVPVAVPPGGKCLDLQQPSGPMACPYARRKEPAAATGRAADGGMPPLPDFGSWFEDGHRCHGAGLLTVTSGRIVAADPLVEIERPPFARSLPPGRYPVILSFHAEEGAWAFALLRLGEDRPVTWQRADEHAGYAVDAGTGCFADEESARLIANRQALGAQLESDPLALLNVMNEGGYRERELVNVCVDPVTGANLVAFRSGVGDGVYPSYFGFDRNGTLVALVTDFKLVDLGLGRHGWLEALDPRQPGDTLGKP